MFNKTEADFKKVTMEEFNTAYQLEAKKEMSIDELGTYIELYHLSYFYASYNHEDVIKAIKEEWDVAEHLKMDYLCIEGIYISIY